MKKGFTLIEVVVAIGLLVMMLGFSGVIFKVGIESHRTAGANAEIMGKLRAITDQLNTDFKGLRKDAPLLIWFQRDYTLYDPNRYDQIMFFANGDFQSTQLFGGTPVRGNVARIYYGQAQTPGASGVMQNPDYWDSEDRILTRRQHILTADTDLADFPDVTNLVSFQNTFTRSDNDYFEHDSISLSQWEVISNNQSFNDQVIQTCFYNRPEIDLRPATIRGLHMLMSQGVGSFAVQWAYPYPYSAGLIDEYRWWPSDDPDGNTDPVDSDFDEMVAKRSLPYLEFGIYFNMPGGIDPGLYWYGPGEAANGYIGSFSSNFYPDALKFTFTLYDSRGIIEGGRTFTHIVYISD